jgi:sugar/nucleoside kinase (ribokinase family)
MAMNFANKCAFLTISRYGAAPSMPSRDEIEEVFGKE